MGRLTVRAPILRLRPDGAPDRRVDTLAVEEPLEIRIGGAPLVVTMRTPGHDVELAAGFLVAEGVIARGGDLAGAIHCGGPGTGGSAAGTADGTGLRIVGATEAGNSYNVLDVTLAPGIRPPAPELARNFSVTSACGVCGKASIDAVETASAYELSADRTTVDLDVLAALPDRLRAGQAVFDRTGGLHAAGLFDAASGEPLVVREDVGRHNAVDKVVGWAVLQDRLPLTGTVLQVSGRASFELAQKASMAGIPVLAAVSAPSSLAVDLATARGLTLVGFSRGASLNAYARADRIRITASAGGADAPPVPADTVRR